MTTLARRMCKRVYLPNSIEGSGTYEPSLMEDSKVVIIDGQQHLLSVRMFMRRVHIRLDGEDIHQFWGRIYGAVGHGSLIRDWPGCSTGCIWSIGVGTNELVTASWCFHKKKVSDEWWAGDFG